MSVYTPTFLTTFLRHYPPHAHLVWRVRLLAGLSVSRVHRDAVGAVRVYWHPTDTASPPQRQRVFRDHVDRKDAELWPHHRKRHHVLRVVVGYDWVVQHCAADLVALRTYQLHRGDVPAASRTWSDAITIHTLS